MNNVCKNSVDLLKGVGLGMASGSGFGMLIAPKKRSRANMIGKAAKVAGQIIDSIL